MYATLVNDRELTLGVSGMLWKRSLVMYDEQTNSYWSHILGRCMKGTLEGTWLKQIPASLTDWKSWSDQHPEGRVLWLSRTTRNYTRTVYRRPESYVLGIADQDRAKAWSFELLIDSPALNDYWNDRPTLVAWDSQSTTARLYRRDVGDRELTFEFTDGELRDRQTRSTWDATSGVAKDGPLKGTFLQPLPAIVSFRETWESFHPGGEIRQP